MNLFPFAVVWGVLATAVLILALYRRMVSAKEDDTIHLNAEASVQIAEQEMVGKKLQAVDKWGIWLTVVVAVTGLILLCLYAYSFWQESSRPNY